VTDGPKRPYNLHGRSFLAVLDQEHPAGWNESFASHTFHEITMYYPMRMIRTRQYKYILNLAHQLPYPFASDLYASPTWQGVLKRGDEMFGKRKVDPYINRPREELYDLESDPNEVKNLATDPAMANVLADLRKRLKQWQENTKDPWVVKYEYE
jgi:N-sulfoglucosamine sulfohydrolase